MKKITKEKILKPGSGTAKSMDIGLVILMLLVLLSPSELIPIDYIEVFFYPLNG